MPVALIRKDGHALWANTAALRAAGIEPTTPDPAGGEIVHDNGALSGILKETAVSLVRRAIPAPEPAERQAALVDSWPDAWARGITGCHDMGYMAGTLFRDLATLRDAGELGLRFVWYFQKDALDEAIGLGLRSGFGDEWLRIGGLKLFLDGTLGSQTAHLVEPYTGLPDHRGVEVLGREELVDLLHRAVDARLAVALHAIGDAAVKKALDGLAALPLEDGHGPLRHRIEHVQLVDPDDIPRFARHRVTASVQPIHLVADALLADRYWGERASHAYPWRSLRDSGATLVFGSDVPVESPDTFAGIHTAVNRAAGRQGRPWHPEQAVSVTDALRAYTAGPAWAAGQDETLGTLEAGKRADLIVVEPDPFSVAPQHLDEVRVLATMIDGVWVWQGPDAELAGPRG
jgi:hypothetical protein